MASEAYDRDVVSIVNQISLARENEIVVRASVQFLKIATIATLAIVTVLGGQRFFDYAMDRSVAADVGDRVRFVVSEDDQPDEVGDRLEAAGLIRFPLAFTTEMRLTNAGLLPGEYTLRKGMTVSEIADRITGQTVAAAEPEVTEFKITIPEGWRVEQIAEEAEKQGLEGGYDAFMAATKSIDVENYLFLQDRPDRAGLEGYLFPNTYTFDALDPEYNIRLMLDEFNRQYAPDLQQRAQKMNLTTHDVLILASLVERETAVVEERPIVAGVYINRINSGWRLDADPTVQYVIGEKGNWWTQPSGEDLEVESPYNTYKIDGLPPAPIANPGIASIQAVLFSEVHDFMYFVGKDDGTNTHAFAVTEDEQNANICQYLDRCG